MYNSQKFTWVHLLPGTERFGVETGRLGNFQASSLSTEQYAIFLSAMATVASNGVKVRTLYVWESDADRHLYIYTESGKVIASYPPPDGYDPYKLSRRQLEGETALDQEQREGLVNSLDPSRVILRVEVAEGPVPIAPPILQPELSKAAVLPGGLGTLGFDPQGEEPLSRDVATWVPGLGPKLTFQNPGKGSSIPIWRRDGPDFGAAYAWWKQIDNVGSDSAETPDESGVNLDSRYYYAPFLDTTYVQAPSSSSLTVTYVAARNLPHTAFLWKPGAWGDALSGVASKASLGSGVYVYERAFSGLNADTVYKYCFTWSDGAEHTAVGTTRTWPEQEDIAEFSFIVYGDNRGDDNHNFQTLHRDVACLGILRGGCIFQGGVKVDDETVYVSDYPPFMLHTGDLVNAGGDPLQWIPHFFRPAGALVSRVPVFPCVGNHETGSGDATVSKYKALFNLPQNATNSAHKERYYWFNYGDCYFVVLDTNLPFGEGSDQYKWLIGSNGCLTWTEFLNARRLFIALHCPPYTDGRTQNLPQGVGRAHEWNDLQDVRPVRETLAPIFESSTSPRLHRKADVVFSGHNHFYERSVYGGVQYVVTGGGGAPLHDPWPDEPPEHMDNDYRQIAVMARHYCRVDVLASGPLRLVVFHENGDVIEEVEVQ